MVRHCLMNSLTLDFLKQITADSSSCQPLACNCCSQWQDPIGSALAEANYQPGSRGLQGHGVFHLHFVDPT